MRNFKRLFLISISAIFVFLSGCSGLTELPDNSGSVSSDVTEKAPVAALPFDFSDSFDPFGSESSYNHSVFPLVYPGLFINDATHSPSPLIAKDYSVSGNTAVIEISALYFSDGSKITANDVLNSFNLAKKSVKYSSRFKYISSYKVTDGKFSVTFKQNAESNLTLLDIPIIKRTAGDFALGAGEYRFGKENGNTVLLLNEQAGGSSKIPVIHLTPVDDGFSTVHSFNKKSVSAVSVDMSTNTVLFKGSYEIADFLTNNFVFVGFNTRNYLFSLSGVRKAFNLIIDRAALDRNIQYAEFTWHPVNPLHYSLLNFDLPESVYMPDLADELLEQSGYHKKKGYYNINELKLIVNSEDSYKIKLANEIAAQLNGFGIKTAVTVLSFADYEKALKNGSFDLYLAETVMPTNTDVSVLNSATVNFSGFNSASLGKIYSETASGNNAGTAFDDYLNESPVISLCYRKKCLVYSRIFTAEANPNQFNIYGGLFSSDLQSI